MLGVHCNSLASIPLTYLIHLENAKPARGHACGAVNGRPIHAKREREVNVISIGMGGKEFRLRRGERVRSKASVYRYRRGKKQAPGDLERGGENKKRTGCISASSA